MTYHSLKAGQWVQEGAWTFLDAPGGWEYYKTFFGGGEVYAAWGLLFNRPGLLATIPDFIAWLMLGVVVFALCRQGNLSHKTSGLISISTISTFEFTKQISTGYIDTCGAFFFLAGFFFFIRAKESPLFSNLILAAISLGLSSATKINFLAASLCFIPLILIFGIKWKRLNFAKIILCALVFLFPVLPWMGYNLAANGHILGCTPLKISNFQFGEAPANLKWFLNRPALNSIDLPTELEKFMESIEGFELLILLQIIGFIGLLFGLIRLETTQTLSIAIIAIFFGLHFSESFKVVRILWAPVCGRLLFVPAILFITSGLAIFSKQKHIKQLTEIIGTICIITGVYKFATAYSIGKNINELFFLWSAIGLSVLLTYLLGHKPRIISADFSDNKFIISVLSLIIICSAFSMIYRQNIRQLAFKELTTMHNFPRHWVNALKVIDSKKSAQRIACAYGPSQTSHDTFWAPFMGTRLQNQLFYISPENNNKVLAHGMDFSKKTKPSYSAWLSLLKENKIDYIVFFKPMPIEYKWVSDNPKVFEKIKTKKSNSLGLFKIKH
jgi:hypothetical protein